MSSAKISLAQQLAEIQKPAPVDHDPEDVSVLGYEPHDASKPRADTDNNAAREHYLDVGPSSLRKLADSISDPKYDGVKVSRQQLLNSDESDGEEHDESVDENITGTDKSENDDPEADSSAEDSENGHDLHTPPSAPADSGMSAPSPRASSPPQDELASTLKRARGEERRKGKAVARQLAMYDSLLDARIRLQKCVSSMNMLPDSTTIPSYLMTSDARTSSDKLLEEALAFSDELFSLREKLMLSNELLSPSSHKRRKFSEGDDAERDWEEELIEHTHHGSSLESSFHPHLLSTLQKWSSKVLAIAPSALLPSNHTKFSHSNANGVKTAIQLVDETLLERDRLVERTKVLRGKGVRVGSTNSSKDLQATDDNLDIFDDTDFYQQLLRDVIDARTNGGGTGLDSISENWRAAQKQRKAKKIVDTRASKGRKLRYEVHEKLQNFMAPVPAPAGATLTWHDSQIDELFASLLGRGFEDAPARGLAKGVHQIQAHDGEAHPGGEGMDLDGHAMEGFRVFG